MKRNLLTYGLAGLLALAGTTEIYADGAAATQMHRPFYGFYLCNANFGLLKYGIAEQYFDTPDNANLLYEYEGNKGVYAGAGIDGILYLCQYRYSSSMEQPTPGSFVSYNTFNGRLTEIGEWNVDKDNFKPIDMTYDYKSGKMYAMGFNTTYGLYEVDYNTGKFTLVCDLPTGATIAASPAGELYTIAIDGILYRINPETGGLTKVFDTEMSGMFSMQSMEFDRTNGKLYWAANMSSRDKWNIWLQEIDLSDPKNVTMTEVGQLGSESVFNSMYIPAASSFDAPAAPTDIKVETVDPENLTAKISWKNPETTFGGKELPDGLNGVVLFRDGEMLSYFDNATPGEVMNFEDKTVEKYGEYRYDIMAFNAAGDGMKGTSFRYIGWDSPDVVGDLDVDVADDFMSARINWKTPANGAHDGYFAPEKVKYNVVRLPDNLKIAEGIEETSVEDKNFRRLLNYSYEVEAYNEIGNSKTSSGNYIIGPALETPFEENFEDNVVINNRWVVLDANKDNYSWYFNTSLGHDVFGDFETAAEYILSPTSVDSSLDNADDWLLSAPIKFEQGKDYEIVVKARSLSPEFFDIYFGKNSNPADMTLVKECESDLLPPDPATGTAAFKTYIADLPVNGADLGCVGINLITPIPENFSSFMQIGNVLVREKDYSGVESVADAVASIEISGRNLIVSGSFSAGAVYSADGSKVIEINSAETSLDALARGVYVAVIESDGEVKTLKFVI